MTAIDGPILSSAVRSYDFYDTLITRLVSRPEDIFQIIGERLDVPDFPRLRIQAERQARAASGERVTFDEIYSHLTLSSQLKADACELELALETELTSPIWENLSQFKSGDIIVSDMYHGCSLFRTILADHGHYVSEDEILVSAERGAAKSDGSIWPILLTRYTEIQHVGDNYAADVKSARPSRISSRHYKGSALNRYERTLQQAGFDGSCFAGAARAARLDRYEADVSHPIRNTFASVFAPLVFAFAEWIIAQAIKRGVKNVFFLSRDGYLPFLVSREIVTSRSLDLDCAYIYGSRQALHRPAFVTIHDSISWMLENTASLTLADISERAGIDRQILIDYARALIPVDSEANLSPRHRALLPQVLRQGALTRLIEQSAAPYFHATKRYYEQVGLLGSQYALVDIGWNGRMQGSLHTISEKAGAPSPAIGLYLCLAAGDRVDSAGSYSGYLNGFCERPERPVFDDYRQVLEAAFSAPHATTTHFSLSLGQAVPQFGADYPPQQKAAIRTRADVVTRFARRVLQVEQALGRPLYVPERAVVSNLTRFLTDPTYLDAATFLDENFVDQQSGSKGRAIVSRLKFADLARRGAPRPFWTEGSFRLSGFGPATRLRSLYRRAAQSARWNSGSSWQAQ